jgi:hypothetical protein
MYPRIPLEMVPKGSVEHTLGTTVLMYIFVIKSIVKKDQEFMPMCTHAGVRTHTRK